MMSLPQWDIHADIRKRRHEIEEYQIAEAWVYGSLEPSTDKRNPGCWRLIGSEVTLVLSPKKDFIITMYPNKHRDRLTAERIANAVSIGATRWED